MLLVRILMGQTHRRTPDRYGMLCFSLDTASIITDDDDHHHSYYILYTCRKWYKMTICSQKQSQSVYGTPIRACWYCYEVNIKNNITLMHTKHRHLTYCKLQVLSTNCVLKNLLFLTHNNFTENNWIQLWLYLSGFLLHCMVDGVWCIQRYECLTAYDCNMICSNEISH